MVDVVTADCSTGEVIERAFTPKEKAQRDQDIAAAAEYGRKTAEEARQRQEDIAQIRAKAKTEPAFGALLRVLGESETEQGRSGSGRGRRASSDRKTPESDRDSGTRQGKSRGAGRSAAKRR